MNKKNIISGILFGVCIFILTIHFLLDSTWTTLNDLNKLILFGGLLAYAVIYFIFVVIFQYYSKWRKFFYDDRINYIQQSLKRQHKITDDLGGIFFLSMVINFFSNYFLLITTPNQIISRIPGFEGITLLSETSNIDLFGIIENISRIDYFLPFTIIGISVFFILRFTHLRQINDPKDKFPGTNPLLAFMYVVLSIIIIQFFLLFFNLADLGITYDTFITRIIFAGIFSMFSIFAIIVAVLMDYFLLKKFKLK